MVQIASVLKVPPTFFFVGAPTAARIVPSKQSSIQYIADFVAPTDGERLIKAFVRLSKEVQRSVVDLVAKIAEREH
jgi:hypothetical protein